MHPFYQKVFDSHYAKLAVSTAKRAKGFYRSLPPPKKLTKEYVKKRLEGLSHASQWTYLAFLKPIEKALGRDIRSGLKPPMPKKLVKRSDLYTKQEMIRIREACNETRDKALVEVLYESGFRAFELLSLDFKDIRYEKALWWLNVVGKGGLVREVPIVASVPMLQQWLNVHPVGEGAIFVRLRRPFKRINYDTLWFRICTILDRAEVKKRQRPIHLFRHTRLTELAAMGLSEAELCTFAGWRVGSSEAYTYIHLSGRDLRRSFSKIYGVAEPEEEPILKAEPVECPRCKKLNPPGARFCSQCSLILDEKIALRSRPVTIPGDDDAVKAWLRRILLEMREEENTKQE